MQHALALQVLSGAAFVHRQLADLDQARARDVAAQAQQVGGVDLVVVAEAVRSAQQGVMSC